MKLLSGGIRKLGVKSIDLLGASLLWMCWVQTYAQQTMQACGAGGEWRKTDQQHSMSNVPGRFDRLPLTCVCAADLEAQFLCQVLC